MFQLNDRPTNNNINNNNNNDNNKTKQRQPQREWQRSLPFIARSLLPNPPSAIFLRLTRGTVSWVVHLLVSHPLSGPTTLSSSYKCVPERSRSRTSVISMDPGEGVPWKRRGFFFMTSMAFMLFHGHVWLFNPEPSYDFQTPQPYNSPHWPRTHPSDLLFDFLCMPSRGNKPIG